MLSEATLVGVMFIAVVDQPITLSSPALSVISKIETGELWFKRFNFSLVITNYTNPSGKILKKQVCPLFVPKLISTLSVSETPHAYLTNFTTADLVAFRLGYQGRCRFIKLSDTFVTKMDILEFMCCTLSNKKIENQVTVWSPNEDKIELKKWIDAIKKRNRLSDDKIRVLLNRSQHVYNSYAPRFEEIRKTYNFLKKGPKYTEMYKHDIKQTRLDLALLIRNSIIYNECSILG